ncbi:AsmA-like C-terminal region-containing protein [Thermopirellula anaerolimosa]
MLVGGAYFYFFHQVDSLLRTEIERQFSSRYPNLDLRLRSAVWISGEGIQLKGIRIRDPRLDAETREICEIEEVFIGFSATLERLWQGDVTVQTVRVRRPRIRAVQVDATTWNFSSLLPLPQFSRNPPPIEIESGTLEILGLRPGPGSLALRDVELRIWGLPGGTPSAGSSDSHIRRLSGTFTGDFLRRVNIEGTINPHTLQMNLEGTVDSLEVSPEFWTALPQRISDRLSLLTNLRAQAAFGFRIFYDSAAPKPLRFDLAGQFLQGRWDAPLVAHPFTDVAGRFRITDEAVRLDEVLAVWGGTQIQIRQAEARFGERFEPLLLDATVTNLEVAPGLKPLLPAALQRQWSKVFPAGMVNLTTRLEWAASHPRGFIRMDLLDASFAYAEFPYRLQKAQGYLRLDLSEDRLDVNITARADNQPVEIRGHILNPLGISQARLSVTGRSIPLTDRLFSAVLNPGTQELLRALHAAGKIDVWLGIGQEAPGAKPRTQIQIDLRQCSVKFTGFPYAISDITGRIEKRGDVWEFRDLKGTHGNSQIQAAGNLIPDERGSVFSLRFDGRQIRLDGDLREALPKEEWRQVWDSLRPEGTVDVADGLYVYRNYGGGEIYFSATPSDARTALEPVAFPYRLENLQGTLRFENGAVSVENLRGRHGNCSFQARAFCETNPGGAWRLRLEDLWIDRLVVDRSLMTAVPESVSNGLARLNVGGPINLRGSMEIGHPPNAAADASTDGTVTPSQLRVAWNAAVTLAGNSAGTEIPLQNIHGNITLRGGYSAGTFTTEGELDLDSLSFRGIQCTAMRGPFRLENDRLLLGHVIAAAPDSGQPSQPIEARLWDGVLRAGGWVRFYPLLEYQFSASLSQADLRVLARDHQVDAPNLRGAIYAAVSFQGKGSGIQGLTGYGNFQLKDADIYELPLVVALLKILSIRRPNRTAFNECEGRFQIAGNHLYWDRLMFRGDAVSLVGQGEMDFDSNLRLTFRSVLGPNELKIPVVKEVFRGASEQIILVHVGGTLKDPQVRRDPLPSVGQALQWLRGDERNSRQLRDVVPLIP